MRNLFFARARQNSGDDKESFVKCEHAQSLLLLTISVFNIHLQDLISFLSLYIEQISYECENPRHTVRSRHGIEEIC
jgi:hypothetical protein